MIILSNEQRKVIDTVKLGRDVIVDATVGSGKTSTIQQLCVEMSGTHNILYLTYSKLLKEDARKTVRGATVTNYHGLAFKYLNMIGVRCGVGDMIRQFNMNFARIAPLFEKFDMLVIDEYQDIIEDYTYLLNNIKSTNPAMQVVMVGDMEQRVKGNTRLDIQGFAHSFCFNPVMLPFTQSFRMGPYMADLLSQAWNKPVVGCNTGQIVEHMTSAQAYEVLRDADPADVLCLGSRSGAMADMLNELEQKCSHKYNKQTVYASIKGGDQGVSHHADSAIFTTYDSSKGLEKPLCVVFDYREGYWNSRLRHFSDNPEIARNIFLVAASRGKGRIIFVGSQRDFFEQGPNAAIGFTPVECLRDLPQAQKPSYEKPVDVEGLFDFKFSENIDACLEQLSMTCLSKNNTSPVINIDRQDGLIDLSPVVDSYQEAIFFDNYDPYKQVMEVTAAKDENPHSTRATNFTISSSMLLKYLNDDPWHNSLVIATGATDQFRYISQVTNRVSTAVEQTIILRMGEHLYPAMDSQQRVGIVGYCDNVDNQGRQLYEGGQIQIVGIVDALDDDRIYELKFVSELSREAFLETAMYMVLAGRTEGVLWNIYTNERWSIRIPNEQAFLDSVVTCISKQAYSVWAA